MTNDPFQYLEHLDSTQTSELIQQAHQTTLQDFDTPQRKAIYHEILHHLHHEKHIPFCQEHHGKMYHFYQDAQHPKGLYRVCTASSYRSGLPEWETIFHVSDFDAILDDDILLAGVSHYVENPQYVLLSLSQNGSDSAYTIEFNLETKSIVTDGFHFPLGKNTVHWRDKDSVWVCPAWDWRQQTQAGYSKQVWLLHRGQSFTEASPILETHQENMMVTAWRYLDAQGAPIDLIEESINFFQKQYYQITPQLSPIPIALPKDAEIIGYLAGQLIVHLHSNWHRANQSYPQDSIIAVKLNKGVLGDAFILFHPNTQQAIYHVETSKHFIIINYLDNISCYLKLWRFQAGKWVHIPTPNYLPNGTIEITDQPWGGDVLYFTAEHFTEPITLYTLDLQFMELSVIRRQATRFNHSNIHTTQRYATSKDGTLIPYFHIGQTPNPNTPTLVYFYGGFGLPELPHYLNHIGKHWLESGNAFVVANIRGGGEFGSVWHQSAQGIKKQRSIDDVVAILDDLYQNRLTSAAYTAIQGGSHGGLIAAAVFCQNPTQIAALICENPLTDMLRYHQLAAGSSWIAEYGHPDDSEVQAALYQLSPYHQITPNTHYPPALITTHLSDDRVHPSHALKLYAKLKDYHQQTWLFCPHYGGHQGNNTHQETAQELSYILSFLYHSIAHHPNPIKLSLA